MNHGSFVCWLKSSLTTWKECGHPGSGFGHDGRFAERLRLGAFADCGEEAEFSSRLGAGLLTPPTGPTGGLTVVPKFAGETFSR